MQIELIGNEMMVCFLLFLIHIRKARLLKYIAVFVYYYHIDLAGRAAH